MYEIFQNIFSENDQLQTHLINKHFDLITKKILLENIKLEINGSRYLIVKG